MRRRSLRWPAVGLVALLVVGGGTAYAVASSDSAPRYRTTAAVKGDVEQTISMSGTVDAAHRADLGFGTDGTIAALKVAVGDLVKAGQILAVLDTTDLDAAVTQAKAAVARAVAQLAADRSAQSSSVQQAVSPRGGSNSPAGGAPTGNSGDSAATAATLKALKALQDEVIDAQHAASAALDAAKSALAAQTSVCADAFTPPPAAAADGTQDDASDQASDAADNGACTTALAEVQARQQDVSDAQDALAKALNALATELTKALAKTSDSTGSTGGSSTPHAARTAVTPSNSETPSSSGGTVTAAQLASDQAQIDQAQADLVTAQQARSAATLRSTRAGRVVALAAAKGDPVTAGSTVATIIGGKAVTITGSVGEAELDQVKVGQQVRVTAPGTDDPADGRVTAIGMVADSSSGSTVYPVIVTVEDPAIALPTGSSALLEIVVSTAKDVVTVPTSAITKRGDAASVRVWDGKELSTEQVTLGATSTRSVEVTKGLKAGDRVVLAAIDDPIDGASSELGRSGFGPNSPVVEFRRAGAGGSGPATFRSGP
jgi:HlyD family secretion protein